MNSEAPNAIGPSERAEHGVVGRAATLGAIGPLQRLQQPIPERLEIHHGGQLLQRIARLAQLRVPILKIEKSKLTRHRIPSFVQRKRITSSRQKGEVLRGVHLFSMSNQSAAPIGRPGEPLYSPARMHFRDPVYGKLRPNISASSKTRKGDTSNGLGVSWAEAIEIWGVALRNCFDRFVPSMTGFLEPAASLR